MALHEPGLAADWKTAIVAPRGQTWPIGIRLRLAGVVVTADCSAISVDVYKDTGESTLFASSGALTPAATTTYDLVTTSTESLSLDWITKWTVTYLGNIYTYRQRLALVGTMLSPRVDQEDLYDDEPDLRLPARIPSGQTDFSPQILAAWYDVIKTLTSRNKEPWLAVDDSDLYHYHYYKALAKVCGAIPSPAGGHYAEAAARYRAEAGRRENALYVEYEDATGNHKPVGPAVYRAGPRGRPSW